MPTDAIQLLREDHLELQRRFEQFQGARTMWEEETAAGQILDAIRVHSDLDRLVFYPAIPQESGYFSVHKCLSDHDQIDALIDEIERAGPTEDAFFAKIHLLCQLFQEHVREEEKPSGIFALARAANVDLEALGGELERRKAQLVQPLATA